MTNPQQMPLTSEKLVERTQEGRRVFYTYIWGSAAGSSKGYPMTFTGKGPRTMAIHRSQPGDLVFGIVSNAPTSGAPIDPKLAGRVACVWQITHATADTTDFGITSQSEWDVDEDGNYRWPYALRAMRIWGIETLPLFRELTGYTNKTHHMDAVTSIREVSDPKLIASLMELQTIEVEPMQPQFSSMEGQVIKLLNKHRNPYSVEPKNHDFWYVYVLTLGDAVKIGYSHNPQSRRDAYNLGRLPDRGEKLWELKATQPYPSEQAAQAVEAELHRAFSACVTQHNQEVFVGVDAMDVMARIATFKYTQPH
ncbi:GIY-YIG nuclease family protein [Tateyamaria sp. Alg231-49]|uniref:GIY-YIG nuclease family protein n=1 Tax=Tateyamaria sp. Alg231-49 TaxID=1922219 RepID=UPI000D553FFA|nr:GIY-YIG nuclease family protein [Tateyamaria sp. Alg231-49]